MSARTQNWQEKLADYCHHHGVSDPNYNIVSDRRGGRTAWSATVMIASVQQTFQARFWYDGQYVQNAKEDAAEVALRYLESQTPSPRGPAPSPRGPAPSSPTVNTPAGNSLNIRGGNAQHFATSGFVSGFNGDPQGRRADGMGVAWSRSPAAAQSGYTKPTW